MGMRTSGKTSWMLVLQLIEASSLPSLRHTEVGIPTSLYTEVGIPTSVFCPKNPSPGQRRRCVSDAILAASLTVCFFHHSHAQPSILAWAQDCSTQSWRGHRIAPLNPGVGTGLPHSILAWAQDCPVSSSKHWERSAVQHYAPRLAAIARKTPSARLYTETHSRTRRPDCPENCVSALLYSSALTDSPPGFPASILGSNAKEWGRSSCFLRQSIAVSSPRTPWCPWCHARASSSGHQNRAKPWL